VIFSSKTIPGNEKDVSAIQNNLARLDIDVLTSDEALVHSSGHPRQDELRDIYSWLKPKALVPMHGEPRHLRAQAQFARACDIEEIVIPRDGHILKLGPGPVQTVDEAYAGRLHVDGRLIVPADDGPARHRRKLSFVGAVFVSVALNAKLELAAPLQLQTDGVPSGLDEQMQKAAEQALASIPKPRDTESVAEPIRTAIRRTADAAWGKKPVTRVAVSYV
jgi:ribonuclease J